MKKTLNSRNQGFLKFFCLLMEGYRSGDVQTITDSYLDLGGQKIRILADPAPDRNTAKNIANEQKILSPGVCCLWPVSVLDLHMFLEQRRL
jgi:hypothetical protein